MSATVLWITLAGGEVFIILLILLSVSWFRHRAQRIRDRKAVEEFVAWVQKDRVAREVSIRSFLADNFGLEDGALDAMAIPIAREEMRLYETFANLYMRRDSEGVKAFGLAVEAAAVPYWSLEGSVAGNSADASDAAESDVTVEMTRDDSELDRLRSENEQLQTELQITMQTISRMLIEYSAMFGGENAEPVPAVAGTAVADDLEASNAAVSKEEDTVASNDIATSEDELEQLVDETLAYEHTPIAKAGEESVELSSASDGAHETATGNGNEAPLGGVDTDSEVVEFLAETDDMDATAGVELRTDVEFDADEPLSDTAADELPEDALGDADLALDDLDDLFDSIADDAPDEPSAANRDDKSVAI